MSHDSDTAESGRALTEARKNRHAFWKESNMKILNNAHIVFEIKNNGEHLRFINGALNIDFYPSTGRWRSEGKTYSGGAEAFLSWYRKIGG
jgi:hypothetical protein